MKSWTWLMSVGALFWMVSVGCSHEQVSQVPQTAPQVASVPQPETMAASETKPTAPSSVPASDKPFVANENLQPVYFEISQLKLDMKSQEALQKNAEWLKQNMPYLVEVAGYTDSRGSAKKNRWLAEHRATMVRDFYVSLGIPKDRIRITGKGMEESSCTPLTEECLAQSRKVETLIDNRTLAAR